MTQEFEVGDIVRIRRRVEPMSVAVVWKDEHGQQWFRTEASKHVTPRLSGAYELVVRPKDPVHESIERLRAAMDRPDWAAALLAELPKQLRNDIALVLTHFMGEFA